MRHAALALILLLSGHAAADLTHELFRSPLLGRVALNPSGTMIAIESLTPEGWAVLVRTTEERDNGNPLSLSSGDLYFGWVDDDTLIVTRVDGGKVRREIFELVPGEFLVASERRSVRASGSLVDTLPLEPDVVLWADWNGRRSRLYRVPTGELSSPTGERRTAGRSSRRRRGSTLQTGPPMASPAEQYRIADLRGRVLYWISDEQGNARAALRLADDDPVRFDLAYRDGVGSKWRAVGSWGQGEEFPLPVGLTPDGRDLLVSSSEGRDTAALRRYVVEEKRLGEVIFSNPGADVEGVLFAYQGYEVIAAYYDEAGTRRYHYFDVTDAELDTWLREAYPGKIAHLTSRTSDRGTSTILLTGPRFPGRYLLVDSRARKITFLADVMPWIFEDRLARVAPFSVESRDGMTIEAFLTLPRDSSDVPPPLVVVPHGGPIGVRDTRRFDPVVQSLAFEGYAVLQVNYRGSAGRGYDFLEAGMGAWGTGIEDDIEAAMEHVVERGLVDPDRVCLFGFSYGGYSSLMGVIRRPGRFRCAAAVAAPSDLLLLFDSSDLAATAEGRAHLAEIVGDPDRDREHLISISPAYRAGEIQVPVLLAHGDADERVDPEHAYRMKAMLEAHGKEFEWMLLEGTSHSPAPHEMVRIMRAVHSFLDHNLTVEAAIN